MKRGRLLLLLGLSIGALFCSAAASAAPLSGAKTILQSDAAGLLSHENLQLFALGGALTILGHQVENAHDEEHFLDTKSLDGVSDTGNVYGNGLTFAGGALGLVATGALAHSPRLLAAGVDLAHSFLLSGALIVAIKTATGRTRPNGGSYSFPSGHVGVAMSAAPVLAYHFGPIVGACAYALVGATAMGRMEDRYHYLSDVVFGATLGMAVGRTVVHERASSSLLSHLRVTPGGAAITYSF